MLLAWMSPSFPIGAFSYSHGLEYAVEAGLVASGRDLTEWTGAVLKYGAGRNDGILLSEAWRAARADEADRLDHVTELAAAAAPTRELALETLAQGRAFADTVIAAWGDCPLLRGLRQSVHEGPAYPVAVGAAAAECRIDLSLALHGYLHAFAANIISAGLRAIPLGQTDGQRALSSLQPVVDAVAGEVLEAELDDLGGATWMVEWCSMRHESQYTRLFRS
ncbi:MAG: urease accessory protein UreF [Geminicoccaceae bacterium]